MIEAGSDHGIHTSMVRLSTVYRQVHLTESAGNERIIGQLRHRLELEGDSRLYFNGFSHPSYRLLASLRIRIMMATLVFPSSVLAFIWIIIIIIIIIISQTAC